MPNLRIVIASMITFVLLLGVMSYVTDKGYDKIEPKLEKQKQRIMEQQKQLDESIRQDLADLGASPETVKKSIDDLIKEEYPGFEQGPSPLRPLGTWMGVRKGKETKIALIKFDKKRYWLMINDPIEGEVTEKGEYEYQYTDIYFMPDDERDYYMEYVMMSPKGFQLVSSYATFTFKKTDNVKLDF